MGSIQMWQQAFAVCLLVTLIPSPLLCPRPPDAICNRVCRDEDKGETAKVCVCVCCVWCVCGVCACDGVSVMLSRGLSPLTAKPEPASWEKGKTHGIIVKMADCVRSGVHLS